MNDRIQHETRADFTLLIVAALVGYRIFFAGFGLGDDAAYARLAAQILDGGYPAHGETAVFPSRPLLLYAIASSLAVFSWHEAAFVLPTMVAAVGCVLSAYVMATLAADRLAGRIAAATLMVSPLHLAYATTLCNDIIGAGLVGSGVSLVLLASRLRSAAARAAVAVTGGLLAGASLAIKLSFGLVLLPTIAVLVFAVRRGALEPRRLLVAAAIGCGAALMALLAFYWVTAGHPLAGFFAEMTFNRRFILPSAAARTLSEVLSFYPRMAFGLSPVGPAGYQWSPTGLLLIAAAVAAWDGWRRGRGSEIVVAACCAGLFLVIQFWPMQLVPDYVPIHRQPRFLYPVTLPAAVLVGLAVRRRLAGAGVGRAVAIAAWIVYATTGVYWGARAVAFHTDAMSDLRLSADIAARFNGPVASDAEMLDYLWFRTRKDAPDAQLHLLSDGYQGARGTLVLVGGSRRPELDPLGIARGAPRTLPSDSLKIADLPGAPGPARRTRGAAVVLTSAHTLRIASELSDACPADRTWVLRDVVDVGDHLSEQAHGYHVEQATWHGDRTLRSGVLEVWDDGRAFVGLQRFEVGPLIVVSDVCLVKRIDPRVGGQVTSWTVDGEPAAAARAVAPSDPGWGAVSVILPGRLIRRSRVALTETFTVANVDINTFRVEVFQSDQDTRPAPRPLSPLTTREP